MSTTTFMNMELPTVSVTLGPEWATELNAALEVVDNHNHTSGSGKPVPVAGLDINDDLGFDSNKAFDLFSTQYIDQAAPLTGAGNAGSIHMSDGDLYYTNGAGIAIQLTSGGDVVVSPGSVNSLEITSIAGDLTINPADTFVYIFVDTTAARSVTLPLAASVTGGRMYVIKDKDGMSNLNNITVNAAGGDLIDGAATNVIDSNYAARWFVGDGTDTWAVS